MELYSGNSPGNQPTADGWSRCWVKCIDEARERDVLMFVSREDEQVCDAVIEAGAELAARQMLLVSPDARAFPHRARSFSRLADASAGIVAVQAGEATRGYSASIPGTNSLWSSCLANPPLRVQPEW
jgi:hypothetical protein